MIKQINGVINFQDGTQFDSELNFHENSVEIYYPEGKDVVTINECNVSFNILNDDTTRNKTVLQYKIMINSPQSGSIFIPKSYQKADLELFEVSSDITDSVDQNLRIDENYANMTIILYYTIVFILLINNPIIPSSIFGLNGYIINSIFVVLSLSCIFVFDKLFNFWNKIKKYEHLSQTHPNINFERIEMKSNFTKYQFTSKISKISVLLYRLYFTLNFLFILLLIFYGTSYLLIGMYILPVLTFYFFSIRFDFIDSIKIVDRILN